MIPDDDLREKAARVLSRSFKDSGLIVDAVLAVVAEPLIQQGRDERDEVLIRERDEAQEAADSLAYAIAPMEQIGEHSSRNNPWQNAREALEDERYTHQAALESARDRLAVAT